MSARDLSFGTDVDMSALSDPNLDLLHQLVLLLVVSLRELVDLNFVLLDFFHNLQRDTRERETHRRETHRRETERDTQERDRERHTGERHTGERQRHTGERHTGDRETHRRELTNILLSLM